MGEDDLLVVAGLTTGELISESQRWMHRRVETVEILTYEETRHRISIDFSLTADEREALRISETSCVVPLGALNKGPRSHFDLCDEAGCSVPVLGREENAAISHIALVGEALRVLGDDIPDEQFEGISAALARVVDEGPERALEVVNHQFELGERGDESRNALFSDEQFVRLVSILISNYIVFAVLPLTIEDRKILKFSFGFESFSQTESRTVRQRLSQLLSSPDSYFFVLPCPGSGWANSFHLEVAIPEELRAKRCFFLGATDGSVVGEERKDLNRVSLHLPLEERDAAIVAMVELIPERSGAISQALSIASVVLVTLVVGSVVGPRTLGAESIVSILLVAAALFGGLATSRGQHRLVSKVFSSTQLWTNLIGGSAVAGALCLAMWSPHDRPTWLWTAATAFAVIASIRLLWSYIKAAR